MTVQRRNLERVQRAIGDQTRFLDSDVDAALLEMTMALLAEVSVLRDRLDSHERLLAAGETVSPGSVDAYLPDEEAETGRSANRATMLDYVMRPLRDRLLPNEINEMNRAYRVISEEVERSA